MVTGSTPQTDTGSVEKYCYDNDLGKCATYGGLYQWGEAMNYSITPGAKGICPVGSHIPTEDDIKTLEMFLGMSKATADLSGWRGTTEGTKMKPGGTSGLEFLFSGHRGTDGLFYTESTDAIFWSSSEYSITNAMGRDLDSLIANVERKSFNKAYGLSVRCLMD